MPAVAHFTCSVSAGVRGGSSIARWPALLTVAFFTYLQSPTLLAAFLHAGASAARWPALLAVACFTYCFFTYYFCLLYLQSPALPTALLAAFLLGVLWAKVLQPVAYFTSSLKYSRLLYLPAVAHCACSVSAVAFFLAGVSAARWPGVLAVACFTDCFT